MDEEKVQNDELEERDADGYYGDDELEDDELDLSFLDEDDKTDAK